MPDIEWVRVCEADDVLANGGACVVIDGVQIAIFYLADREEWFATQNRCPHWDENVLWRAMTGEHGDEPKIACPMHKKTFSLASGECISDEGLQIATFAIRIENGEVFLERPSGSFLEEERSHAAPLCKAEVAA